MNYYKANKQTLHVIRTTVYSDWLERKCGTSTWILQISWFVGLSGPQTQKEGYLTLIFNQRWYVEHRLEYFKSADGYLWQYLYGNVSLMIRVHKGHISMPGSRGPLFTFHSYFLLFFRSYYGIRVPWTQIQIYRQK